MRLVANGEEKWLKSSEIKSFLVLLPDLLSELPQQVAPFGISPVFLTVGHRYLIFSIIPLSKGLHFKELKVQSNAFGVGFYFSHFFFCDNTGYFAYGHGFSFQGKGDSLDNNI